MRRIQFWAATELVDRVVEILPESCSVVDRQDVPGNNMVMVTVEGQIFPEDERPLQVYPMVSQRGDQLFWDFQLENLRWVPGRKECRQTI